MASAQGIIVGSLGGDPELRFTPNGDAVANFSVAVTERVKDGEQWKDGDTTWYRVTVWRAMAENVVETLHKGDQVIVIGKVKLRSYEKDGVERQSLEITADEVGPSLRWARAQVEKVGSNGAPRSGGSGGGGRQQSRSGGGRGGDPWGSAPAGF